MASQISGSKQRAIDKSKQTMFIWIAAMSAVIGICVVVAIFLVQLISYKANVLNQTKATADTLHQNNKVAQELVNNVVALNANTALGQAKAYDSQEPLAVVLDALPADYNSLAFGSSLQQKLLSNIDGLSVESIIVDNGSTDSDGGSDATTTTTSDSSVPVTIQATATNINAVQETLRRLERSIRVIDVDSFTLETTDPGYSINIEAHAYYQPEKSVQLTNKTIPVKETKKHEKE